MLRSNKMNPEIKALWIAALRSGDYAQGKGALTIVGEDKKATHCCLGVLCDLAAKAGITTAVYKRSPGRVVYNSVETAVVPWSVQKWSGLPSPNPTLGDGHSCATWNDKIGADFVTIADMIDKHL